MRESPKEPTKPGNILKLSVRISGNIIFYIVQQESLLTFKLHSKMNWVLFSQECKSIGRNISLNQLLKKNSCFGI